MQNPERGLKRYYDKEDSNYGICNFRRMCKLWNMRKRISQGDEHYVIDADACLDCGTCADACPTEAIHPAE